jgi:hypothetical protein
MQYDKRLPALLVDSAKNGRALFCTARRISRRDNFPAN